MLMMSRKTRTSFRSKSNKKRIPRKRRLQIRANKLGQRLKPS